MNGRFDQQIAAEDQQRDERRTLQERLGLVLGNQQRHWLCVGICQERHCGNRDHGVDKEVGKGLQHGSPALGQDHIPRNSQPGYCYLSMPELYDIPEDES